jgi:hypothetical protein
MPELRAKETSLSSALAALDAQLLDRDTYLALAENLEGFLTRLRGTSEAATIEDRQKVVRSVVKGVLVGPERVVIRHSIPAHRPFRHGGYPLRLRSLDDVAGEDVAVPGNSLHNLGGDEAGLNGVEADAGRAVLVSRVTHHVIDPRLGHR